MRTWVSFAVALTLVLVALPSIAADQQVRPPAVKSPYKIGIFPASGCFASDGSAGCGPIGEEETARALALAVRGSPTFALKYSYYEKMLNSPRMRNPDRLWIVSAVRQRPNLTAVYAEAIERGLDGVLMYWGDGDFAGGNILARPVPIELYAIDVSSKQVRRYKSMTDAVDKVARQALSTFSAAATPKVATAAPTQRAEAKGQAASSVSPFEGITLPAGGSVKAINAAAEAYCGSLNKKSKLVAAPPNNPNYVFQCYQSTKVASAPTSPTIVAKAAPEIQQGTTSYKIGIFPALGGFAHGRGPGTPWEEKYAAQVFASHMNARASSLSLAYSYYDPSLNQPPIYDYAKVWAGSKPKLSAIYREAETRHLDAVFMYHGTGMYTNYNVPTDPMPIQLYLIDVKQQRTYAQRGDTDRLEKMMQALLSQFLEGQPRGSPPARPSKNVAKVAPPLAPPQKTHPPAQVRREQTTGSAPYKIAIFPFESDTSCIGQSRPAHEQFAAQLGALIKRNDSLALAYSYYDQSLSYPPIGKPERLWKGPRPNLTEVTSLAKTRGVDAVVMYWRASAGVGYCTGRMPPFPIDVYVIDVGQRKMYRLNGDEENLSALSERALSRFLTSARPKMVARTSLPMRSESPPMKAATPPALTMRAPVTAPPGRVTLRAGTGVPVELMENVNSELNQEGDTVSLRVTDDIYVEDRLVIQKGATVQATVGQLQERGEVGKSGKLTLYPMRLKTADGQWATLHKYEFKGESADASGRLAGAIIAFGLWGLLAQGNAATILEGTHYQVVIAQDIVIDTAAVQPLPTVGQPAFRANAEFKKVSRVKFSKGKRGKDIVLEIALTSEPAKQVLPSTSTTRIVKMGTYVLPHPIYPTDVVRDDKHNVLSATFDWWEVIKYSLPEASEDAETPVLVEIVLPDGRIGTASAALHANWTLD